MFCPYFVTRMKASQLLQCTNTENNLIKLTHYDETKKRAHGPDLPVSQTLQIQINWLLTIYTVFQFVCVTYYVAAKLPCTIYHLLH